MQLTQSAEGRHASKGRGGGKKESCGWECLDERLSMKYKIFKACTQSTRSSGNNARNNGSVDSKAYFTLWFSSSKAHSIMVCKASLEDCYALSWNCRPKTIKPGIHFYCMYAHPYRQLIDDIDILKITDRNNIDVRLSLSIDTDIQLLMKNIPDTQQYIVSI